MTARPPHRGQLLRRASLRANYNANAGGSAGDAVPLEEMPLNFAEVNVGCVGPHEEGTEKGDVESGWKAEGGE